MDDPFDIGFNADSAELLEQVMQAIGLWTNQPDGKNGLTLDNWGSIDQALNIFTSQRIEAVLDIITNLTGLPSMKYRLKSPNSENVKDTGGLLAETIPIASHFREEWFNIFSFPVSEGDCSISLTAINEVVDASENGSNNTSGHLNLGVGFNLDYVSNGQIFNMLVSVPIVRITISGSNSIDFLLFGDGDATPAEQRISVSASIRPSDGNGYDVNGHPKCSEISLQTALGKGGSSVVLTLHDYEASGGVLPNDLVIDEWGANEIVQQIVDAILPAVLNKLSGNNIPAQVTHSLLPMLGITESSEELPEGVEWPQLDIVELVGTLINGGGEAAFKQFVRDWISAFFQVVSVDGQLKSPIVEIWLSHLYHIISGEDIDDFQENFKSNFEGEGTLVDPWSVTAVKSNDLKLKIRCSSWVDSDDTRWVQLGLRGGVEKSIQSDGGTELDGGIEAALVRFPLSDIAEIQFLPQLDLSLKLKNASNQPDFNLLETEDDDLGILKVHDAEFAMRWDGSDMIPVVALNGVVVGDNQWDVLDLTSADTPEQLFDAAMDMVRDKIASLLNDGGMLQTLGAMLGVCPPPIDILEETSWKENLLISSSKLITDPLGALRDYYRKLLAETHGDEGVQGWLFLLHSIGSTIEKLAGYTAVEPSTELSVINALGLEGSGSLEDGDPWRYRLLVGKPRIDIIAWSKQLDDGNSTLGLGVEIRLANFSIDPLEDLSGDEFEFRICTRAELIEFTLPSEGSVETSLLRGCGINLKLIPSAGTSEVAIGPVADTFLVVPKVFAEFGWTRKAGLGWQCGLPSLSMVTSPIPSISGVPADQSGLNKLLRWNGTELRLAKSVTINPTLSLPQPSDPANEKFFRWNGKKLFQPGSDPVAHTYGSDGWIGQEGDLTLPLNEMFELNSWMEEIQQLLDQSDIVLPTDLGVVFPSPEVIPFPKMIFGSDGVNTAGYDWDNPNILKLIRRVIGHLLMVKGGVVGFLMAVFFRIHPDVHKFNLTSWLEMHGVDTEKLMSFSDDVDWPLEWLESYFMDGGVFGLGPLTLPYDWPNIDWSKLTGMQVSLDEFKGHHKELSEKEVLELWESPVEAEPWKAIKEFFGEVFTGSSKKNKVGTGEVGEAVGAEWDFGEPFAIPCIRWLWVLLNDVFPDINLGKSKKSSEGSSVKIRFKGDGTYHNPWTIYVDIKGWVDIELLIWLDPEGLDQGYRLADIALAQLPQSTFDSVKKKLDQLDGDIKEQFNSGMSISDDWANTIADILLGLQELSPKVKTALGGMSKQQIAERLMAMNEHLQDSDGQTSIKNQVTPEDSISGNGSIVNAGPFVAPNHAPFGIPPSNGAVAVIPASSADLIKEVCSSIERAMDAQTDNIDTCVLCINTPDIDSGLWTNLLFNDLTEPCSVADTLGVTDEKIQLFDFDQPNISGSVVETLEFSGITQGKMFTLDLGSAPGNMLEGDYLSKQVEIAVQHIVSVNSSGVGIPKVFLVGHGLGGKAAQWYLKSDAAANLSGYCGVAVPQTLQAPGGDNHDLVAEAAHMFQVMGLGM